MEGVGARLGRSSTRYGPATVFSGPVRKWKKRWVHVSPSNNNNNNNSSNLSQNHNHNHNNHNQNQNQNHHSINATTSNGNNGSSHLLLYRWTPLTHSSNKDGTSSANGDDGKLSIKEKDDDGPLLPDEPPRRKFKYFPVYLLEKEKYEAGEESKESDAEPTTVEQTPKGDDLDEKPDINDTPMEETQAQDDNQVVRQDLNESTLDLSLGLNSHDDDSDAKPDQSIDGQLDRVNSSSAGT